MTSSSSPSSSSGSALASASVFVKRKGELARDRNAHGLVASGALHDGRPLDREACRRKTLDDAEPRDAEPHRSLKRIDEMRELRHFVKLKRALNGLAGAGDFENIERKRHGHPQVKRFSPKRAP